MTPRTLLLLRAPSFVRGLPHPYVHLPTACAGVACVPRSLGSTRPRVGPRDHVVVDVPTPLRLSVDLLLHPRSFVCRYFGADYLCELVQVLRAAAPARDSEERGPWPPNENERKSRRAASSTASQEEDSAEHSAVLRRARLLSCTPRASSGRARAVDQQRLRRTSLRAQPRGGERAGATPVPSSLVRRRARRSPL